MLGLAEWKQAFRYSVRIRWSPEDQEFVATCEEFPLLSWLSSNQIGAFFGLKRLLREVLRDMREAGETPPRPDLGTWGLS